MVNRTLQQKRFKMKRRGKSRPWSETRLKATRPQLSEVVDYLNLQNRHVRPAVSGHVITPTLYSLAQAKGRDAMPRPQAIVSAYNMLKVLRDVPDLNRNVTLFETAEVKYMMFMNLNCTAYVLLEIQFEKSLARASVKYNSRDSLIEAFNRKQVRWLYFEKLSTPIPDGEELNTEQL